MLNFFKWLFTSPNRDLSKHRIHTTKYQDLCM